jgi:hypothetical protein
MGDITHLPTELERTDSVKRAKLGLTGNVVKAEIRLGEYNSLTAEIIDICSRYGVMVSHVGGDGINYYMIDN